MAKNYRDDFDYSEAIANTQDAAERQQLLAERQNKIDAVVIDEQPAQVFVGQTEGLVILDESFTDEEYAAAVKKGNTALLDAINGALASLEESGKLDEIVAKYITAE